MLQDVLTSNLRVLFVGTAAGNRSAELQYYYAHKQNRFWSILHEIRLTTQKLKPEDYEKVLEFGIGLTDIAKGVSGMDRTLTIKDFDVPAFEKKVQLHRPLIIAFNGKKAAELVYQRPVEFGPQATRLGESLAYVMPSTSPAAKKSWNRKIWFDLADAVQS